MTTFGSGIELDQDLDLVVSPSGDIATVEGVDELKKDLSYRLIYVLDGRGGQVFTADAKKRLKARIRGVLLDDDRVTDVTDVAIETAPGPTNHLTVTLEAVTASGPFEQVVTV